LSSSLRCDGFWIRLLAIHWDTDFDTALPANSLHARKRREFYTHLSFGVQSKMDFSDWRGVKVKPIQWSWQALAALGGFDVAAGQFQTAQPHHRVTNIFRTETMSREHCFRVADHPGVIAWWLESKCRMRPLLQVARDATMWQHLEPSRRWCNYSNLAKRTFSAHWEGPDGGVFPRPFPTGL
jgi:hypothetical protein